MTTRGGLTGLGVLYDVAAQQLAELVNPYAKYRNDLPGFVKFAFGVSLWSAQKRLAKAFVRRANDDGGARVAVKSGHKTGKSLFLAALAWWFAACYGDDARVLMVSTTGHQVKDILWMEVSRLHTLATRRGLSLPVPALDPGTGVRFGNGATIKGLTGNKPEALAGYSGGRMLIIIDEASGVPDRFFEALMGNTAGIDEGGLFLASNPTMPSGHFYNIFKRPEKFGYDVATISSAETPNARAGKTIIKGLAGRAWVAQMARSYGVESSIYSVRVLGKFPDQSDDCVIPSVLVSKATAAWEPYSDDSDETLHVGLDVARFGDDETCLAPRRGLTVNRLQRWRGLDTHETARRAYDWVSENRGRTRVVIKVDGTGVGAGVVDALRAMKNAPGADAWWLTIVEVNNASATSKPTEYYNLRAESWFMLKGWFKMGGTIPGDEDETDTLELELLAPRYVLRSRGSATESGATVVLIEDKAAIKKRLGRSPDGAEAVVLAVWDPGIADETEYVPYTESGRLAEARGY